MQGPQKPSTQTVSFRRSMRTKHERGAYSTTIPEPKAAVLRSHEMIETSGPGCLDVPLLAKSSPDAHEYQSTSQSATLPHTFARPDYQNLAKTLSTLLQASGSDVALGTLLASWILDLGGDAEGPLG
ncbi:hypothetical protein QQS21_001571 [Conoideocrella luteorostrata]|uniref:Uncharacterized protein n=1 Tax=Conoideocrella luteorostrata TaxID=1105319 RepID=A0AAJ0CWV7_9HYPO|nr:hypothetical protein QQS21_001571 [Conoideocrella luteorostrata]